MARTKQTPRAESAKRPAKTPAKKQLLGKRPTKGLKLWRASKTEAPSKPSTAGNQTSESDSAAEGKAEHDDNDDDDKSTEQAARKWSRQTLFKRRVRKAARMFEQGHALLNEQAAVRCVQSAMQRSELNESDLRLKISAVRTIHDIADSCMTQVFSHAHDIVRQSKHSQLNDGAVALAADFWAKHNDLGVLHGANEILRTAFTGAKLL